jgi:hypothetical protein
MRAIRAEMREIRSPATLCRQEAADFGPLFVQLWSYSGAVTRKRRRHTIASPNASGAPSLSAGANPDVVWWRRAPTATPLGTSGSNVTFESRGGFPQRSGRASLRDACRKIHFGFGDG